jgi:aryl-alcohol dehydrogenase-like predicted oxidoreductase
MYQRRYADEMYGEIAARFSAYAQDAGVHPATLAVAWVMAHPAITAPIIGARTVQQLEASLAAVEYTLDAEQHAAISALSYEPPLATDRSDERK